MKGKLHVYTGNGKGKTTAAMGLALRSLGHGRRVLIAQFLKDGRSGELAALCTFEQATIYPAKPISGFVFAMSPEEKEEAARQQNAQAADIQKTAEAIQPALTVLDELNVAKPCIDMADEGYNCEWSQELKLDQSFEEYLKAFVLLYVLRDMLNLPVEAEPGKGPGFIFNMSAGYNLEGIKSPALQRFLDRMENAEEDVKRIKAGLAPLYPAIEKMPIPARLSDNLTVSTMHGCPPDEVESIGRYFITERKYNTAIKLNPTLLGPERLRDILNTQLGYDVCVPDEAFGHDLKYNDGVAIIRKALEAPMRAIAQNAGFEGSVVVEKVKSLPKGEGLNCANGEYGNMIEMGVNDPVKVTRTALQSAASVAALILITEATINEIPKDPDPAALAAMAGAGGGMGGMM